MPNLHPTLSDAEVRAALGRLAGPLSRIDPESVNHLFEDSPPYPLDSWGGTCYGSAMTNTNPTQFHVMAASLDGLLRPTVIGSFSDLDGALNHLDQHGDRLFIAPQDITWIEGAEAEADFVRSLMDDARAELVLAGLVPDSVYTDGRSAAWITEF